MNNSSGAPARRNSGARRNTNSNGRPSGGGYRGGGGGSRGPSRSGGGGYRGGGGGSRGYRGGGGGGGRSYKKSKHGQYIDPAKFVKAAKPVLETKYESEHHFDDFAIDDRIKQNLHSMGISRPTKIQDLAIPVALTGKDLVGLANTGTGKTIAFLVPILNKLVSEDSPHNASTLIITPTRELAMQIQDESRLLARGLKLWDVLLIGGTPLHRQVRDLKKNPRIIIGTPGRIKDLIQQRKLDLSTVSVAALDEADRMLDMGFIKDVESILSHTPDHRQSMFFSATITDGVKVLMHEFSDHPEIITATTAKTSDNVEQTVEFVQDKDHKLEVLTDLLDQEGTTRVIVFCEMKHSTTALTELLNKTGHPAEAINGNKSQSQRQRSLDKFKKGRVKVLVATDVAARGIDVKDISHVVNFDVPQTYDDYTHRIGRTGRANTVGHAVTFVQKA